MTTEILLYFTIILSSSALAKPYQNQSNVDYCELFGCTKENADFYCPRLSCEHKGCNNWYWKNKNICDCDDVCEPEKCSEEFRKKKCPMSGVSTCEDSYLEGNNVCTCTSKDHCKVYECDAENRRIQCKKICDNGESCYQFYVEGNYLCACSDEPLEKWPFEEE